MILLSNNKATRERLDYYCQGQDSEREIFWFKEKMAVMNLGVVDLTQLNMEEMIGQYREEKVIRLINMIIENSKKMLELQKMIVMLTEKKERKKQDQRRRQEDREQRRREYKKRWEKEEQKKRKEKKEEE